MKSLLICTSHLIFLVIKSKRVRWTGHVAYDWKWEIHTKFWTDSINERVHMKGLGPCQSMWHHIPDNSTLHPDYMVSHHKMVLYIVIAVRTWDSTCRYSSEGSNHSVQLHSWFNDLMIAIGGEYYRVWNSLLCSILLNILFLSLIHFIIKYHSNKKVLDLD
jgi:hypothetical protein